MPILHYKITKQEQSIVLNTQISARSFIFRRAMVVAHPMKSVVTSTSSDIPFPTSNNGGFVVQPSYLNGFEITSGGGVNSNDLLIPTRSDRWVNDVMFQMEFDSEDVNRAFTVETLNYNKTAKATFLEDIPEADRETKDIPGVIRSIDLFFEYAQNYNYETF